VKEQRGAVLVRQRREIDAALALAISMIPEDPTGYAADLAADLAADAYSELDLELGSDAFDELVDALADEIENRQCADCLRSYGPSYEGCRCKR